MGQPTVAVLGTASDDFVLAAAIALKSEGAPVTVILKRDRESCVGGAFPSRTFSGRISWCSLRLLAALRGVGARRIVVVVGDTFAHANVTNALNWWRAAGLLRGGDVYVSFSTQPAVLECFNTIDQRQRMAAATVALFVAALFLWLPIATLVAASVAFGLEWVARRLRGWPAGERPGHPASAWPLLASDPHLGWRLRPVQITAKIATPDAAARTIRVTVDDAGQRVTGSTARLDSRPAIAFYGGSYAFGDALSDEETIPWHASALLGQHRMLNRTVPGYSALQSLTRLLDDLAGQAPAAVVAILDGHDITLAGNDPSSDLPLPYLGHARFPLSERCAMWWWSARVLSRAREHRRRELALRTISTRTTRQRIPIVMAVAGKDRAGLGRVLYRCGFQWTAIDEGASRQSTAQSLTQHVRAALARPQRL